MDKKTVEKILNKPYISRGDKIRVIQQYAQLYDYHQKNKNALNECETFLDNKEKYGCP